MIGEAPRPADVAGPGTGWATPPSGRVERLVAWAGPRLVVGGLILLCFSKRWDLVGIPIGLDRPMLFAGLALCTLDFFRRGGRLAVRTVHLFMLASLVWVTISALSVGTLSGSGLFALVDRFGVLPFTLFVLAPAIFSDPASRLFLARAFTLFGLYLGITSLAQVLGFDAFVWPQYILDPSVGIHADRARGPFTEGVANGLMLVYTAAFAGFVAATGSSRRWRAVAVLTILLCSVGVVLTLTRAVWLGAAVAGVVTVASIPWLRRRAPLLVLAGAAVLTAAFVVVPDLDQLVTERSASQAPLWDRYNTNWAAVRMVLENPVTGVGWRQSPLLMEQYVRQGDSYPVTAATAGLEVHNVFLSRLADLGLVGAFFWIATFVGAVLFPALRRAETPELRRWRHVLMVVVIAWFTAAMFGPVTYPQPNYVIWALAGLVLVTYLTERRPRDLVPPPSDRSSLVPVG